ncbi:tyrosine-type recombinase/integrase [Paenarthrobacter sp. Z7-10]|uniref:tyrosine-type recombinase/integrase n=1 Tax=Paenarthrobacter sp. Z7-10 TaxID=2787635 RepID=UPI0022A96E20|nr:tyrosine-type recombinase/integrase [Paenarthrobacter sp. Z7-10]MCZ2404760.1 tyrosine-type recombinase/integrase [Paenarthrobacter sp. Z7-10]
MTWDENVTDYLRLRRQLGARLAWSEHLLHQFATHLTAVGVEIITVTEAINWCSSLPEGVATRPLTRASRRMTAVRGLAVYMHALNPIHEVPPRGVFAGPTHRQAPYIYTSAEITAVIRAAALEGGSRAQTYPVLFALLAATGLRVGEALALDRDTTDLDAGVLLISRGKGRDPRLVPLHPSATAALERYAHWSEDQHHDRRPAFFTDADGKRLKYATVRDNWVHASTAAGLRTATRQPRMHDLRHTFAVNTLLGWYRDGANVAAKMPALSIYLGHSDPANTYWYLSAVPELLAHAAARLDAANTREQVGS